MDIRKFLPQKQCKFFITYDNVDSGNEVIEYYYEDEIYFKTIKRKLITCGYTCDQAIHTLDDKK